jgi:hypothetical protein
MAKFFNTAGFCNPEEHYMVDPLKRLTEVEYLIKKKLYFTIHEPRQTGKTTYLHTFARKLNQEGKYVSLVVSFERAGFKSITVDKANEVINHRIFMAAENQLSEVYQPPNPKGKKYFDLLEYLSEWCQTLKKPLVLLIDEIDSLQDDTLISILRQLRDGYQLRPNNFPSSVALVGLRDVRDYKAKIRPDSNSLGTASPFNIKAESLMLNNFTKQEVFELLEQHERETKQRFPLEIKEEIFNLTNGQPWLVNAVANQIVRGILKDDYSKQITLDIVNEAKNQLILRRDTHLDSLADKLKEQRVKRVVQAIINGESINFDILDDDLVYMRDLGLVSQTSPLKFANSIYAEIILRIMLSPIEVSIPEKIQTPWFLNSDRTLNMDKVLQEFQKFYQRNSEFWIKRYEYRESAQHLLLLAFLQRIVNAGGEIIHEMALGNNRLDLLVKFQNQEFALELKIWRDTYTIEDGKEQLSGYLDKLGQKKGYLIIFDPRDKSWEDKIYTKEIIFEDKKITMVGL